MEKSFNERPRLVRGGVLAALMMLTFNEVMDFFNKGGGERPFAMNLLKIQLFLFLFIMFFFSKENGTIITMMGLMKTILEEIKALNRPN
jgi:hypothetical protein